MVFWSTVWNEYRQLGKVGGAMVANIEYRKADGNYGVKNNVRRRAGQTNADERKDFATVKMEQRVAGYLYFFDEKGQQFKIFSDLLIKWNGKFIDDRF